MATKYIAHLEIVRNHTTRRFIWEKEEFDNKWDAEKRCEEHRKRRFLGAWVQEVKDEPRQPQQPQLSRQIQEHTEHTIDKYCDRFFMRGGRLF